MGSTIVDIPENYMSPVSPEKGNRRPSIRDIAHSNYLRNPERRQVSFQESKVMKDFFQQHLERRIFLCFFQLIVCYKWPDLSFIEGETQNQYGIGSRKTKTQGAHSATIPYLCVQRKNQAEPLSFLYDSHYYTMMNSTVETSETINLCFDKSVDYYLREINLQIINRVAQGKLTPVKGVRKFTQKMIQITEQHKEEKNVEKVTIFQFALQHLKKIQKHVRKDAIFDQLLGVQIEDNDEAPSLREQVYEERFALIKQAEITHTCAMKAILDVQKKCYSRPFTQVQKKTKYTLLQKTKKMPIFHCCLERLFCTSLYQMYPGIESKPPSRQPKTLAISEDSWRQLKQELRQKFMSLREYEKLEYRGNLLQRIRENVKHWTKEQLVEEYQKAFPKEKLLVSKITRIETHKEALPKEMIPKIATVFHINTELFYAYTFASDS